MTNGTRGAGNFFLKVQQANSFRFRPGISDFSLRFGFGLAQPGYPVAWFPLAPFLEDLEPFEAFEDIPFAAQGRRGAQTTML